MYFRSIELGNVACFKRVKLDFNNTKDEPAKWIVIVGENATGKSTTIKYLTAVLSTNWEISGNRRKKEEISVAYVSILLDKSDYSYLEGESFIEKINDIDLSFNKSISPFIENNDICYTDIYNSKSKDNILTYTLTIEEGWFVCGYGVSRSNWKHGSIPINESSFAEPASRKSRFGTLFGDTSVLTSVGHWLADLDYRQIKETDEDKKATAKKAFDKAIDALQRIVPEKSLKFIEITPNKEIIFEEESGMRVTLNDLSDGYQSTIVWVVDLVRRLVEAFPDMENPLEATGVVMVDEIDLHLHPRWQRTIVKQIRNVFPNLQFIVTTHSPFILQDMNPETDKIIILKRDGDKVIAEDLEIDVRGWRAEQILTSPFFGLDSTYDEEIEKNKIDRQAFLDKRAQEGLTDAEREELNRITKEVETLQSAPTETGTELLSQPHKDQERLREIAARVLELLRKTETANEK
jgi:predicted ATP-binding protein involved in virulence